MFRWHVISGIMMRNLKQYFTGALGYVFIIAFVTISALMTFNSQFFADNLANLDQLTRWFPLLLLFFAPAVAMSVWAEERRSGTDAILFTLPATDLEILLGKYLSLAAVYTISLLFSFTQLIALNSLGSPDWGVIAATYFGYWLAGLALLSIGMFASSLTESTTVAFVLGALLCAIPVLVGSYFQGTVDLASWFGRSSGELGAAAPDGIVADAATKA
ncbi:MAG: ABC transporter permease, partial [Planctomycetota bacterium]